VVGTNVFGSPARPGVGLAFKGRIRRAENGLAEIVEAVRRVMRHFFAELDAGEARLELLDDV